MYNNGTNGHSSNGSTGPVNPLNAQGHDDDEIDLKKIFMLLLSYKWLIVSVTIAVTVGSYFYAKSLTPIYQGDGTMIISQNGSSQSMGGGSDLNSMLSSSFGIGQGSQILNELEVLRSRMFAGQIADQILEKSTEDADQAFPVLWRSYPDDQNVVTRDSVVERLQNNMSIDRKDRDSDVIRVNYDSPSPEEAALVTDLVLDTYSQFSIDQNRSQTRSALDFLTGEMESVEETLHAREEALRDFMNREKLIQLDSQTEELITAISGLEIERQTVSVQKVGVNSAIESYRKELDGIKPGFAERFAEGISGRLTRYQFQLAELETEKMLMLQKNPQLEDNPGREPEYQRLLDQVERLRGEITRLAGEFIDSDDNYLSFFGSADGDVAGRVNEMTKELMILEIDAQQYEAQAEVLDARLAEYNRTFDALPDNMVDFARLKRDVEVNEQLYLTISQQSAELAVMEQTQASMGRIVDYSIVPIHPISPRTKLIVLIGFVLGGMLSLGLVFLREMSITQVNSLEKLKQRGFTLLGVIPDTGFLKKKLFNDKKRVDAGDFTISTDLFTVLDTLAYPSEAYRRLLNNIMYAQPDMPYKTLVVTSPNKGEGKSSLISNLAVTMAESGKKVVILDCDFRRPRQHKVWGIPGTPGLVDVLFDKIRYERVIQPTLVENLEVITGGMKPPNPAAVIQSNKMKELIEELKDVYDIVLIDSPPFGIITDAAPLIQLADGIVLVSRFGVTREAELDQCIENLNNVQANIIGTAMMGYDSKKASGYAYDATHYKYAYESYTRYQEDEKA